MKQPVLLFLLIILLASCTKNYVQREITMEEFSTLYSQNKITDVASFGDEYVIALTADERLKLPIISRGRFEQAMIDMQMEAHPREINTAQWVFLSEAHFQMQAEQLPEMKKFAFSSAK